MKKLLQEARYVLLTCDAGKFDKGAEVIDALEAAIAQDDGEPVAWMDNDGNVSDNNDYNCFPIPLYAAPQVQPESDLTIAYMAGVASNKAKPVADYVPLSDEDIDGIGSTYEPHSRRKFARLVERAVRGMK